MDANAQFDTLIERPLAPEHPALLFRTPNELSEFFHVEREWFTQLRNTLQSTKNGDAFAANGLSLPIKLLNDKKNAVIGAVAELDKAYYEKLLNQYVADIGKRRLFNSRSRIGVFVSDTSAMDVVLAGRVAALACSTPMDWTSTTFAPWSYAATTLSLVEQGIHQSPPKLDVFLEQFAGDWGVRFSKIESAQQETTQTQLTALSEIKDRLSESNVAVQNFSKASGDALLETKAELLAIKKTYEEKLALQEPATYWSKKKVSHRWAAFGWAVAFSSAAVGGGLFVWNVWDQTAQPLLTAYGKNLSIKADAVPPSYGTFLPTIAAAFLIVWVLRIISRQIIASLSMSSDAAERATMLTTFLSLMQKPEHVKEDDRILILSALFRPSSITGEDAAPPNWFDILMQRVKPRN
jgi:hypothetical protein